MQDSFRYSFAQLFFKFLLNIVFVRERLSKQSGGFGCYRNEWIKEEKIISFSLVDSKYYLDQLASDNPRKVTMCSKLPLMIQYRDEQT